jgi:glycosyltransferase involved in cell wall biosynthesis
MPEDTKQPHRPHIAAILPTYNEEANVATVLETLHNTAMVDEIIIVDDGSVDHTVDVLNQCAALDTRIRILRHEKNQGKGQAMFTGWAATNAACLLLLDSDLKNLKPEHIQSLLTPMHPTGSPLS